MITNVVYLHDRWISLAQLRAQHVSEPRRGCDQHDLMAVKDSTLNSELNVAELGIVNEFRIDSRSVGHHRVPDWFYRLPTETRAKYVGQQERRSFLLNTNKRNQYYLSKKAHNEFLRFYTVVPCCIEKY